MKTYTLDQIQDKLIGEIGTQDRDRFEFELQMDLIGKAIKQTRIERQMTQEEFNGTNLSILLFIFPVVSNFSSPVIMPVRPYWYGLFSNLIEQPVHIFQETIGCIFFLSCR